MSAEPQSSSTTPIYFMRSKGKIFGPYGLTQLQTLRRRGQLSRIHEVSRDRVHWQPAGDLPELFEAATGVELEELTIEVQPQTELQNPAAAPPGTTAPEWHYSVHGRQLGPISQQELVALITSEEVSGDDLVWTTGMPEWVPSSEIPHLQPKKKKRAPRKAKDSADLNYAFSANHVFCSACGAPVHVKARVCPKCGVQQHRSGKDRTTTALLALFLGGLGVHRFYLGQSFLGILYLLFFWTFIPAIVSFVEGIVFLCMSDDSFDETYNA